MERRAMELFRRRLSSVLVFAALVSLGCRYASAQKRLSLDELQVPEVVDVREDVTLRCRFDVGSERLYSVKWYKDEFEFYRYMPDNLPPSQTFIVPGVKLKKELCSMDSVTLTDLSFSSSGMYRCEVSTEAPNFETIFKNANMTVMALPLHDPMIEGVLSSYSVGDIVRANCTSAKSKPPATLSWFINGIKADRWLLDQLPVADSSWDRSSNVPKELEAWQGDSESNGHSWKANDKQLARTHMLAPEEWLSQTMPLREEPADAQGLVSRSLGLSFAAERRFFQGARAPAMELRCVAAVGGRARERTVYSALASLDHSISASRQFNAGMVNPPCCISTVMALGLLVTVFAS